MSRILKFAIHFKVVVIKSEVLRKPHTIYLMRISLFVFYFCYCLVVHKENVDGLPDSNGYDPNKRPVT